MAQASNIPPTIVKTVRQLLEHAPDVIEEYDEATAFLESDDDLTSMWSDVKDLEDALETLREDVIEQEMRSRVEPGGRLCGVSLIQSHNKYVTDDAGTVIGRAANRGIDYTEFVSLNASTLASDYPDLASIGRREYDYFR